MPTYHVRVRTKLGSLRSKDIAAANEEEAILAAKEAFPLHESVWVEGEADPNAAPSPQETDTANRIMEMKRDAEIAKAQSKRTEGLIWLGVGVLLLVVTFLFLRNAFLIAFAPVIWGWYIFKTAERRIKTLTEERSAGLPFLER